MSKQEEIREGMKEIIELQCSIIPPLSDSVVDLILSRQSYQGVVLKVERELPHPSWRERRRTIHAECQQDMLKAGYTAWEPLIKEE